MSVDEHANIFVRHPDVIDSAVARGADARILTGDRGSADRDMTTIVLPSANKQIPQDCCWTPQSIQDYVNASINNRVNNEDDPSINVPGIANWLDFLTWDAPRWNTAIHVWPPPGNVDPWEEDRRYSTDPGQTQTWGKAFLGIRLPVSREPLTWADVLHIRNVMAPTTRRHPILRLRPTASGRGGRKKPKTKRNPRKSRKHRQLKRNTRHRRTRR